MKNIRWRLILIAVVVGLSIWSFYPPESKIKLGLDLKGGVHLVLRVHTDDALRVETETTVERLRDSMQRAGVQFTKADVVSPTEFRVEGIQDDAGFRSASVDADTNYDRSSETGGYSFRMKPNIVNQLREQTVAQALETIERRVNELGVAEPIVARYSGADQILVQLPGVSDVRRAKEIIRSTAQLKLTLVDQGPFPNRESALQAFNNNVPSDVEILPGRQEGGGTAGTAGTVFYAVKRAAAVTGRDLRNAQQSLDEFNRPAVHFTLKQDAAARFGNFTQTNISRPMAIVLDNRVMSVATIQGRITDSGQITGINHDEMVDTVITLKSGALPASMDYLEERTVGPSLGAESMLLLVAGWPRLRRAVHGVLLQAHGPQCRDLDPHESRDPARTDGVSGQRDDAAGYCRVHSDDRHGRRFERADLRADQGGARDGPGRPGGGECRIRPGVVDDRRHTRLIADSGAAPAAIRHQYDPRIRHHVDHRTSLERVYCGVHLADGVRIYSEPPADRRADSEYLTCSC
jgi:protein-export membrane protein SecD